MAHSRGGRGTHRPVDWRLIPPKAPVLAAALLTAVSLVLFGAPLLRFAGRSLVAREMGGRFLGSRGVVFQRSPSSCGSAALEMVLLSHGVHVDSDSLVAELGGPNHEASMLQLTRVAAAYGLTGSGWELTVEMLRTVPLPAIAHLPEHYVVVDSMTNDQVYVRDPAVGIIRLPMAAFNRLWTRQAIVFGGRLRPPDVDDPEVRPQQPPETGPEEQ